MTPIASSHSARFAGPEKEPAGRAPDFLILGAAKAATTWLTHCLAEHPEVFIPPGREEWHHFTRHYDPADPLPVSYRRLFAEAGQEQVCGENSNSYLWHPEAAERIAAALPQVKLIVSLRNPVERAYADYGMHLRQHRRFSDLPWFLDPDYAPTLWFLRKGLYHQQLQHFLARHPRERMHIMLADDLARDAGRSFAGVCRFLAIDEAVDPPSLHRQVNTRNRSLVLPRLRAAMRRTRRGQRVLRWLGRSALSPPMRALLARPSRQPPLPQEIRRKMIEYYRPDVRQLEKLLERDLSHWLKE